MSVSVPGAFEFVPIADTDGPFSDFAPYVASLNRAGTVSFQAALKSGGDGVYTGCGGPVTAVVESHGGRGARFVSHPAINARGMVSVYAARPDGGQEVVRLDDGAAVALARTGRRFSAIGPLGPTMNEDGAVALRADPAPGIAGIFVGQRGSTRLVADTRGPFAAFQGLPVINRHGAVAFRADLRDGSKGIFLDVDQTTKAIADTRGEFRDLASFPSVNDDGTVAFGATLHRGGTGVFTWRAGRLTAIIEPSGAFESVRNALINLTGTVIFAATPPGGALGVFAGPDPMADRILAVGDSRFGSTVAEFALNPVSFNDAGQLAIRVKLTNGRQLIVRADPST